MKAITTMAKPKPGNSAARFWAKFRQQKYLYMMAVPFVLWAFVFSYLPLWGWTMAFQKYKPGKSFFEQKWVGLQYFRELFQDEQFFNALRNTLAMSIMGLLAGFIIPIIFAVLLNEVRLQVLKRFVQTVSYLPHFVSWVVAAGIITKMLSTDNGAVNDLLRACILSTNRSSSWPRAICSGEL